MIEKKPDRIKYCGTRLNSEMAFKPNPQMRIELIPAAFQGIIEKFMFIPKTSGQQVIKHEIFPDGYFDLVFLVFESYCKIVIIGPCTKKKEFTNSEFDIVKVRFRVGKIPLLFNLSPSELVDNTVELNNLFGIDADFISEQLLRIRDGASKLDLIDKVLAPINFKAPRGSRIYCHSTSIIESYCGLIQVGKLAQILNVSVRTLERKFIEDLGMSPKAFIRLVRFQRAIEILKEDRSKKSLTAIAYELGYSDQAHFIHDFKEMSGILPGSI